MLDDSNEIGGENMAIIRPSWADPRYILATNESRFTTPAVAMNAVIKVANANPNRWMIGFSYSIGGFATVLVAPQPRPDLYGLTISGQVPQQFFTVFGYGTLVSGEWYAYGTAAGTLGVYEGLIL